MCFSVEEKINFGSRFQRSLVVVRARWRRAAPILAAQNRGRETLFLIKYFEGLTIKLQDINDMSVNKAGGSLPF